MKKLLLSIAFLLPGMGMMAQTQVKTAEGKGINAQIGLPERGKTAASLRKNLTKNNKQVNRC